MGNPGINVLVPAAKLSDVRPMGEGGRHVRFTVTSGGARSRAVGFGIGAGSGALRGGDTPHDLAARLESNEWRGSIEPRLVVRSLHPVEEAGGDEPEAGCTDCACRMNDEAWWTKVWDAFESDEPTSLPTANREPRTANGERRTEVDRHAEGSLGALGDLLTTGEPLLVVCADVSRRAALLERDLDTRRFGRPPWVKLSSHCDAEVALRALDAAAPVALADHSALWHAPDFPKRFVHVFVLDPAPSAAAAELLARSGAEGPAFLHLGWGEAEVDFAQKLVEHEHALRPHLAAVYRALKSIDASIDPSPGAVPRAALEGDGRHPRSWPVIARCMRVLAELDLARFERSSGTVKCTITAGEQADLERSDTFRASAQAGEEELRYLKTLTSHARTMRAA
jgi:hypothetical protein